MKNKTTTSLLMGLLAVSLAASPCYASTQQKITDTQNAQQENQQKLDDAQSRINSLESKKDDLEGYLQELNQQLGDLEENLQEIQTKSDETQKTLEKLEKELEAAKEKEAQQYNDMKLRIQYMYENAEGSYVVMLLESNSISDFLSQAENMSQITNYDRDMLEEDKKTTDQTQPETKKPESNFEEEDSSAGQAKKVNLFDQLFANNNKLLTVNGSDFAITNETRRMLALFSDGTYLVSKDNRFDGAVYNFEANVKRRKIPIKAPRYVTLNEIAAIYAYAERGAGTVDVSAEEAEDMQMQIDFINIIQRASQKKVSDVHIIVGSSSTVLFRENGIMVKQNEYGGEWGEAFVRAVFASADISDSNYSQNEFQGAQKLGSTPLRGSKGKLMLPHNVLAIRLQFNPIAFGSQYLVMRLLYADDNPEGSSDLRSLGLGKYEEDLFYKMRSMAVGLNVVAGPTGSGKSTTLQRNMIKLLQEKKLIDMA